MLRENYMLLANYNRWMNDTLYTVCAQISDEDRRRDMGAFFRSIHSTLNHLLYGDKAWMGRFVGELFKPGIIGQDLYESFAELQQERQRMDQWIIDWASELDEDWLQSSFSFVSGVDGKTRTAPAWSLVTHMFNHQTHHRGQVTTLIKQLGHEPGITDIPWLPGLCTMAEPAA